MVLVNVASGRKKLYPAKPRDAENSGKQIETGLNENRKSWCLSERKEIRFFCLVGINVTVMMLWF